MIFRRLDGEILWTRVLDVVGLAIAAAGYAIAWYAYKGL